MKSLLYFGSFSLIAAALAMINLDANAAPKKIVNSGNAKATGGNGGNANGKGSVGGNGGSAIAVGGSVNTNGTNTIVNSGNATATGGNGGNANGKGSKGGNGGGAVAVGGDIGKIVDPLKKKGTTTGSGNADAKGGNGGNATGPGAQGGNGGDAIAVSGNNNTVINGNNNTIIGKQVNNNISLNIGGGRGAGGGGGGGGGGFDGGFVTPGPIAVGGFGGDGTIQGTPGVAVASSPSETVIRTDGAPAIARGQDGKDNVEQAEREEVFTRRFLKVKNESNEAMKVFVQFRGVADKKWAWIPADPNESKEALAFDLKPGQEMYLSHNGQKVSGSRVRVWGVSEKSSWLDYRDQDLWVVPEMDARGEHRYTATEMRTFTFVFPQK